MESATDKVPANRRRIEGHDKTKIPQETMLEVLRWLGRFDLDGKQMTSRRLRSLVENNQMPLRKVAKVCYREYYGPRQGPKTMSVHFDDDHGDFKFTFEADADVEKAVSYLSSCFVRKFDVCRHSSTLPTNAVIAAPPLIRALDIRFCAFDKGEEDTLSATLDGSTFRCLSLFANSIPAWQIDDKRLESLRRRGCNEIRLFNDNVTNYEVTEEGILSYCFTSDDDLAVPERRSLQIAGATITPAFFKKVVEASKNSQLTCDVQICLEDLRLNVSNLDVGVPPSRSQDYDRFREAHIRHVRYDLADHGNGIRLLIHFKSQDNVNWEAVVRHGKKDHNSQPQEEEEAN